MEKLVMMNSYICYKKYKNENNFISLSNSSRLFQIKRMCLSWKKYIVQFCSRSSHFYQRHFPDYDLLNVRGSLAHDLDNFITVNCHLMSEDILWKNDRIYEIHSIILNHIMEYMYFKVQTIILYSNRCFCIWRHLSEIVSTDLYSNKLWNILVELKHVIHKIKLLLISVSYLCV